jgi:hypothetical protein
VQLERGSFKLRLFIGLIIKSVITLAMITANTRIAIAMNTIQSTALLTSPKALLLVAATLSILPLLSFTA